MFNLKTCICIAPFTTTGHLKTLCSQWSIFSSHHITIMATSKSTQRGQHTLASSPKFRGPNSEGEFSTANAPSQHVFGVWEETGAPGGNPRRHGENVQTPHRQWPEDRIEPGSLALWGSSANHCATVLPHVLNLHDHYLVGMFQHERIPITCQAKGVVSNRPVKDKSLLDCTGVYVIRSWFYELGLYQTGDVSLILLNSWSILTKYPPQPQQLAQESEVIVITAPQTVTDIITKYSESFFCNSLTENLPLWGRKHSFSTAGRKPLQTLNDWGCWW